MIALFALFFTLTVVALGPFIVVSLGHCTGNFVTRLECFLDKHESSLISVGLLILVSGLALWGTYLTNHSAERREKSNRKVLSELKVSEYRQAWITEMRLDLSIFGGFMFHAEGKEGVREALSLKSKIEMRLNMEETLAINLYESMNELWHDAFIDEFDSGNHHRFTEASNAYLKKEWKRLKKDIREALILEASTQ